MRFANSSGENGVLKGKPVGAHAAKTFSDSCITKSCNRIASCGLGKYLLVARTARAPDRGCSLDRSRSENTFSLRFSKNESASAILRTAALRSAISRFAASLASPRRHQKVVKRRFGALSIAARSARSQSADQPHANNPNSSSTPVEEGSDLGFIL